MNSPFILRRTHPSSLGPREAECIHITNGAVTLTHHPLTRCHQSHQDQDRIRETSALSDGRRWIHYEADLLNHFQKCRRHSLLRGGGGNARPPFVSILPSGHFPSFSSPPFPPPLLCSTYLPPPTLSLTLVCFGISSYFLSLFPPTTSFLLALYFK